MLTMKTPMWTRLYFILWCGLGLDAVSLNDRPVIGIFTQKSSSRRHGDTLISANYVKYMEQAGARVVPIRVRESQHYYQQLFSQINGVLYPGGHTGTVSSDYAKAGKIIYELAEKANDAGDYFPLWGTCEGFQMFSYLSTGHRLVHASPAYNVSLPLVLDKDFRQSKMMKNMPQELETILTTENITPNFHHYGISVQTYEQSKSLRSFYRILSTNTDTNGKDFISTAEAFRYPFYGIQWHVEKLNFEWSPHRIIDHSSNGVLVSQYFANFFVNEARKNTHKFSSMKTLGENLIENFFLNYWDDGSFQQIYYINYTSSDNTLIG